MRAATPGKAGRAGLFLAASFALLLCVAFWVTTAHPAHLEAMAAPEPPPSTTLAYGRANLPSPQAAVAMAPHAAPGAQAAEADRETVVGEGQVIAVIPSSQQLVVDHKAIEGFMDAMTMGFRVRSPALLEGVQAGDRIRFRISTREKSIIQIEKREP